jgi:hypothetical protein
MATNSTVANRRKEKLTSQKWYFVGIKAIEIIEKLMRLKKNM